MTRTVDRTVGSRLAILAGTATAILGILGLAGVFPKVLVEVAAITGGLALLGYGGTIAARVTGMSGGLSDDEAKRLSEIGIESAGYSAAQTAGVAGVVLGILALLGVASGFLPPVTIIVLGGALMYSAGSVSRLLSVAIEQAGLSPVARVVARERAGSAVGGYAMAGIANVALGILAIVITGVSGVLTLVAFLALGVSLLGGSVLASSGS